ncbi:hypothetical protein BKA83DRAFT_4129788 [Pisolithus microcarpus]|nr:hypothetical protein BKA83DRAFT_4129788 [Pisolithus microcarpus]
MANNIMAIYHRLISAMKHLGPKERYSSWKEAVKAMSEELQTIRAIAHMTDVMPCTLISVDKYICWTENVGSLDCPFLSWKKALKPNNMDIAGHLWLLIVECQFNLKNLPWMMAATPSAPPHATTTPTTADRGKGKEIEALMTLFGISPSTSPEVGNEVATPHVTKKAWLSSAMGDTAGAVAQPCVMGQQQEWAIIIPLLKGVQSCAVPPALRTTLTVGTVNQPSHHALCLTTNHTNHGDHPSEVQCRLMSGEGDLTSGMVSGYQMVMASMAHEIKMLHVHIETQENALLQDVAMGTLDSMDTADGQPSECMDVEAAVETSGSGKAVHGRGDDGNCSAEDLDHSSQPTAFLPATTNSPPQPEDTTMQEADPNPHPASTSHSTQAKDGMDCDATSMSQAHQGNGPNDVNVSTVSKPKINHLASPHWLNSAVAGQTLLWQDWIHGQPNMDKAGNLNTAKC